MTNKQTGVLRQPDQTELQTLIDIATAEYQNTIDGPDEHFRYDDQRSRWVAGVRVGAYVRVLVASGEGLIPEYIAHTERGYSLHPEATVRSLGASFTLALWKPEADQLSDLATIHAKVEADYAASIAAHNKAIVDKVVAQRVAEEERKEAAAVAKHRGTRHAAIEKEVLCALSGGK